MDTRISTCFYLLLVITAWSMHRWPCTMIEEAGDLSKHRKTYLKTHSSSDLYYSVKNSHIFVHFYLWWDNFCQTKVLTLWTKMDKIREFHGVIQTWKGSFFKDVCLWWSIPLGIMHVCNYMLWFTCEDTILAIMYIAQLCKLLIPFTLNNIMYILLLHNITSNYNN